MGFFFEGTAAGKGELAVLDVDVHLVARNCGEFGVDQVFGIVLGDIDYG